MSNNDRINLCEKPVEELRSVQILNGINTECGEYQNELYDLINSLDGIGKNAYKYELLDVFRVIKELSSSDNHKYRNSCRIYDGKVSLEEVYLDDEKKIFMTYSYNTHTWEIHHLSANQLKKRDDDDIMISINFGYDKKVRSLYYINKYIHKQKLSKIRLSNIYDNTYHLRMWKESGASVEIEFIPKELLKRGIESDEISNGIEYTRISPKGAYKNGLIRNQISARRMESILRAIDKKRLAEIEKKENESIAKQKSLNYWSR